MLHQTSNFILNNNSKFQSSNCGRSLVKDRCMQSFKMLYTSKQGKLNQSSNNKLYYFETCISLKFLSRPVTAQVTSDRQLTYKINAQAGSHNHWHCEKVISITNAVYVYVALVIQHANHMCHAVLLPEAWPAPPYSSTVPHQQHDFQKKMNTKCVFWFSLQILSGTFVTLKNNSARYHKFKLVFM